MKKIPRELFEIVETLVFIPGTPWGGSYSLVRPGFLVNIEQSGLFRVVAINNRDDDEYCAYLAERTGHNRGSHISEQLHPDKWYGWVSEWEITGIGTEVQPCLTE